MTCVSRANQDTDRVSHDFRETFRDDNEDRTRVCSTCRTCGTKRLSTYAKRRGAGGQEWWGPIGVWQHSEVPR